jgi:biotin synthase
MNASLSGAIRHDWTLAEVESLFAMPFVDLLFHAQRVHREYHEPSTVQMSTLLSIKTGACPEDCAYCPQSVRYDTGLDREALMEVAAVRECAKRAKEAGATRFCMGAAYRSPKAKDLAVIAQMIREVRSLGLETCATLGMLTPAQAMQLKDAGLDYYNHNLDTSEEFYGEIISTRTYQDRLDTLRAVRDAGLKVCCGGIVGMGETLRIVRSCSSRSRICRSTLKASRSINSCRFREPRCTAVKAWIPSTSCARSPSRA